MAVSSIVWSVHKHTLLVGTCGTHDELHDRSKNGVAIFDLVRSS